MERLTRDRDDVEPREFRRVPAVSRPGLPVDCRPAASNRTARTLLATGAMTAGPPPRRRVRVWLDIAGVVVLSLLGTVLAFWVF